MCDVCVYGYVCVCARAPVRASACLLAAARRLCDTLLRSADTHAHSVHPATAQEGRGAPPSVRRRQRAAKILAL